MEGGDRASGAEPDGDSAFCVFGGTNLVTAVKVYVIRKQGDQWCVLSSDESEVLGCHDTEEKAKAQLAAIEAAKARRQSADPQLFEIKGVEVFATGEHNGDKYSTKDLDDMAEAAAHAGYHIPLKQGHTPDEGAPALGWVENVRRAGGKLLADLVDMTKEVYDQIKSRRIGQVSPEIWWNMKNAAGTFRRALKAVALLGAEVPAVPNLKPAWENLGEIDFDILKAYTVSLGGSTVGKLKALVLTVEQMDDICESCADTMRALNFKALKIPRDPDGTYQIENIPPQMLQGLCDKYGAAEGFRTRCMADISAEITDPGAFCNALKAHCTGLSQKGETKMALTMLYGISQNDGKFCANLDGEMLGCFDTEEEARAKLKDAETKTAAKTAAQEDPEVKQLRQDLGKLQEERRQERIAAKVATLKIPAWRDHARIVLDALTAPDGQVKKYSLGKVEKTAAEVYDAWLADINVKAEKMFGETAIVPQAREVGEKPETREQAGEEVRVRIHKYAAEKSLDITTTAGYEKAQDAVLQADPELAKLYAS